MLGTIGEHFQDARINAGIGLTQLAREIGISLFELRKIEIGEVEPLGFLFARMVDRLYLTFKLDGLKDNKEF